MSKMIASLLIGLPMLAMADILPPPLPGDMPLHRIGYEIVIEMLAASAAGIAAVRALVKRRWKIRRELSSAEHESFEQRISLVLPRLLAEIQKADLESGVELRKVLMQRIAEDSELKNLAENVSLDTICDAFRAGIYDSRTGECRFAGVDGDKLKVILLRLRHDVSMADFVANLSHKTLLENVLARNDDLGQALEGVPIELINESLVPMLPPEIRVERNSFGEGEGFLWTTEEDLREIEAACRSRYVPWNLRGWCIPDSPKEFDPAKAEETLIALEKEREALEEKKEKLALDERHLAGETAPKEVDLALAAVKEMKEKMDEHAALEWRLLELKAKRYAIEIEREQFLIKAKAKSKTK